MLDMFLPLLAEDIAKLRDDLTQNKYDAIIVGVSWLVPELLLLTHVLRSGRELRHHWRSTSNKSSTLVLQRLLVRVWPSMSL